MVKFCANLTFLFTEVPFQERFAAAAAAGFAGVEYMGAYDLEPSALKRSVEDAGVQVVLFNTPTGDWAAGERGLAAVPGREQEFKAGVHQAVSHAEELGNKRVHVMAGIVPNSVSYDAAERTYIDNLTYAAEVFAAHGLTATIEPINTFDMPGYFLNGVEQARELMVKIDHDAVRLQFDVYHAQIMGGNLAARLSENLDVIAHIQIAGNPGRHEPDIGEINYPYLFDLLDRSGYDGWIGCEYKPKSGTVRGLDWMRAATARSAIV